MHEVKLLKLLNKIGALLYAYKIVMEWAREAYQANYKSDNPHASYNHLENKLQFRMCHPQKLTVKLEQDNMEADIVVFDVKDMLASLFNSPKLNQY